MGAWPADRNAPRDSVGWYVHVPFCAAKCGYCDFYSVPIRPALVDDLVWALRREMAIRNPARPAETVFVGGGTPTIISPPALRSIIEAVTAGVGLVKEFTVEANPSSIDQPKLDALRKLGVNRLSLGAQSFDSDELALLQRTHQPHHIAESVAAARAAGFENLNLDLVYAIPGQTLEQWRHSLHRARDLEPEHLSCYCLTYEPGTPLTRLRDQGRIIPCDQELEAEMFELTIDELSAAGYQHYEVSNFARPGRQCRGNVIYWENREYLGLGPSAVSYLDGLRCKNVPEVRKYIELMHSDPAAVRIEQERLTPLQRARETAVQMLRLTDGIDVERFRNQTGHDPRQLFAKQITDFTSLGLMEATETRIRLTPRGMLLANRVSLEFLPDPAASPPE
jgi:oxygen-independent coproporphyrinogen-3 oxidase